MAELTREQWKAAKECGNERLCGVQALSARYDAECGHVLVRLTTGVEISFAPQDAEELQHATQEDLHVIKVDALGLGLRFSRLDADLDVLALLEGVLGSEAWTAVRSGTVDGIYTLGAAPVRSRIIRTVGQRRKINHPI